MPVKTSEGDKKYYRILNIISRLNDGPVRSSDLAAEFNISIRSVQRDLERINMTGFSLDSPAKGTYRFAPGISLRGMSLSNEQLSALVLMNDMAAQVGGSLKAAFDRIFVQLTRSQGFESPFHAILQKARRPVDPAVQKELEFAIEHRRRVRIIYDKDGRGCPYELSPLKLIFSDGFFYLLATGGGRPDAAFLKYRADKIKEVILLDACFAPPSRKILQRLLSGATSIWGVSASRDLVVKLRMRGRAAEFFRSKDVLPGQKVLRSGRDCLVVESRAGHPMEIIPHVLQWMPDISVVSPAALREEVRARAEAYLKTSG